MVEGLVGHGLLGELGVGLVGVGDEGDAARVEHAYALDLSPLGEVARNDLLDVVGDVDAANVDGSVLAHEAANTSHIVTVVGVAVAAEAIHIRIEQIVDSRQTVQVLAVLALGADAAGEEEAEVGAGDPVGLRVAAVLGDITAALGGRLG